MKVKFTKEEVIESLRTEALFSGSFMKGRAKEILTKEQYENCRVCAVGGIIRRKISFNDWEALRKESGTESNIDDFTENTIKNIICKRKFVSTDDLRTALKEKNWLGALSIFFERMCDGDLIPDDSTKQADDYIVDSCVHFVEKHFPKVLHLDTVEN